MEQLRLFEKSNPLRELFGRVEFAKIPVGPGIYWMTDRSGDLLYIGKAKCLRQRLKSYRTPSVEGKTNKIQKLLARTKRIQWMNLPSEAQALKEEMRFIKEHCPPCNTAGVPTAKKIWLEIETIGLTDLRISRSFNQETRRRFGPYLGIPGILLFQTALVRRLWAIANESTDFPPQLTRNVS
ncbi:MAG: nucleotide excision repair endonuclease, partial [Bdellovibrionota bacterium]